MKKLTIILLPITLLLILLSGCVKDRSNKTERPINEVELNHWRFGGNHVMMQSDSLTVNPGMISSMGLDANGPYRFEWVAITQIFSAATGANIIIPLSNDFDLRLWPVTEGGLLMANTTYSIRLRVTDTNTGVFSQASFGLRIDEAFSRGWLVMNEVDEGSGVRMRLDMLELRPGQPLLYHRDILLQAQSQLPMEAKGRPIGIRLFEDRLFSPSGMALYILTETGSNRLAPITFRESVVGTDGSTSENSVPIFSWRERWSFRNHFLFPTNAPADLTIREVYNWGVATLVAASDDNLYYMAPVYNMYFGEPINRLVGGGPTFRASHHIAGNGIVFDLDSSSFRQARTHNPLVQPIPVGDANPSTIARFISYERMTGFELVAMFDSRIRPVGMNGTVYIIMRHTSTGRYWIMQSNMGDMRQDIWEELGTRRNSTVGDGAVTQALIHQAAQQDRPLFVGGGFFRDIFYYAVGGKIYAYDIAIAESILVADFPGETVTFMRFQHINTLAGTRENTRDILVGIWDGTRGRLEQFEVQNKNFIPVNIDYFTYPLPFPQTEFGKIIDVLRR